MAATQIQDLTEPAYTTSTAWSLGFSPADEADIGPVLELPMPSNLSALAIAYMTRYPRVFVIIGSSCSQKLNETLNLNQDTLDR